MPFGMVGWLGPRMRQVIGIGNCPTAKGNFGGVCGMSCTKQWALLHSCIKVYKAIKLPFGAVSGVGRGIGVLDGSTSQGKGEVWVS